MVIGRERRYYAENEGGEKSAKKIWKNFRFYEDLIIGLFWVYGPGFRMPSNASLT
jgi:DNA-binding PadR family transcriptional regulator